MTSSDYLLDQLSAIRSSQAETDRKQVRFLQVTVTAVDTVAGTFDAAIEGEQDGRDLAGIPIAHPHFTPDVGDVTMIEVSGAQPIHRPLGIGENAIDDRELAAEVVLATTAFIAGNPAADHVIIDGDGMVAYADDPVDGIPNEVARFGRNSGTTSSVTGQRTSSSDEEGNFAFHSVTTDLLTVGGLDLVEALKTYARGTEVWYGSGKNQSGIVLEFAVAEVVFQAEALRNYTVAFGGGLSSAENDGEYTVRVRWTTDGSRPTLSSPIMARRDQTHRVGGRWQDWEWSQFFQRISTGLNIHLLLTIQRGTGQTTGSVSTPGTPPFLRVEDKGVYRTPVGTNTNDGTTTGPAPVALQIYDQEASWSRSFRGDGTIRSDTTDIVQGYYSVNGDGKAMFGWPDLTTTLSGATVQSVEVYLSNYYWYYNAGGTLILGTHAQTAAPASFSGTSNRMTVGFGPGPSGKWIDVTSWASEFAAGTTRGFVLGPSGGTNRTYYGRFGGATDANAAVRPRLRIVYYK